MYHVSTRGVDEHMINVHYYYFMLALYTFQEYHYTSGRRSVVNCSW